MANENRTNNRRKFSYYVQVFENVTLELFGYITDISSRGFRLDSVKPHGVNRDYTLRIELTGDIFERSYITFVARVMWIKPDPFDSSAFIEGYKVISISPAEEAIFNKMLENYSSTGKSI